jgi:DNA invertase Pin-like site-specific DNA recombinase
MNKKRRVYSYIRCSSKDQLKGDSLRRQRDLASKFAEKNNYILDAELDLSDKGVSGYKGLNRIKGRLGDFLDAVENGTVETGSILFIEKLDRYSRANPTEAFNELFQRLFAKGISLATADGKVYDERSQVWDLMPLLMFLGLANQESKQKSERLKSAFAANRLQVQNEKAVYNTRGPFWVTFKDGKFVLNERHKIIIRIFDLYLSGHGSNIIKRILSEEKIPSPTGGSWQSATVMRYLRDRKVIGEFQMGKTTDGRHTKVLPSGPPIANYYPPCISVENFLRVQKIANTKPKSSGKTSTDFIDIFEGLIFCGNTGKRLNKVRYGQNKTRYYKRYLDGLTDGFSGWQVQHVEKCFYFLCKIFDFKRIFDSQNRITNKNAKNTLVLEEQRIEMGIANINESLKLGGDLPSLVKNLQEEELKLQKVKKDLENLNGGAVNNQVSFLKNKGAGYFYDLYLRRDESKENRLRIRRIISEEVEKVLLFPNGVQNAIFLPSSKKYLLKTKLPTIGIISSRSEFCYFMSFENRCKSVSPVPIHNQLKKRISA